jgi:hypothetical protein
MIFLGFIGIFVGAGMVLLGIGKADDGYFVLVIGIILVVVACNQGPTKGSGGGSSGGNSQYKQYNPNLEDHRHHGLSG